MLEICAALDLRDVVFVGHSVSAMIGVLAAAAEPDRFAELVLVGPSPRYLDDGDYVGGFSRPDIEELLDSLDSNYLGWSAAMAPVIMGNPDRPAARRRADEQLLPHRPGDRPALRPGHLPRPTTAPTWPGSRTPALVLQCSDDAIAPSRGRRVRARRLPGSRLVVLQATGHCPNLSAPEETVPPSRRSCVEPSRGCTPVPEDSAEDLYENAPCGYLSDAAGRTDRQGQRDVPATGPATGRDELVGRRRFQDLLTPGGRIFHETHYAPLLHLQESVREIAVELVRADGSRLPALINSVLRRADGGIPAVVRTTVFDATDRREYERELVRARRAAEESEARARLLARTLQESLIPPALPERPGPRRRRRLPAGRRRGDEVGGDFYDVFEIGRGDWARGDRRRARQGRGGGGGDRARPLHHPGRGHAQPPAGDRARRWSTRPCGGSSRTGFCSMLCARLRRRQRRPDPAGGRLRRPPAAAAGRPRTAR